MQTSYLYILVYTQKNVIKIGKSDNVVARITSLKKHWGEPDYDNSYSLEIDADLVFKIEKALHLFLVEHAAGLSEGDGKTEFFTIECLDQALEYLEVFTKRSDYHVLKKGIKAPEIDASKKLKDTKLRKYTIKQERLSKTINDAAKNLGFLLRIVGILQKYREQIKYHYKIDGNHLIFTLEDKRLADLASNNMQYIADLFFMKNDDFNNYDGESITMFSGSRTRQGMQLREFSIRIHNCVDSDSGLLLEFLTKQYRQILLSLPKQSPAYIRTLSSN